MSNFKRYYKKIRKYDNDYYDVYEYLGAVDFKKLRNPLKMINQMQFKPKPRPQSPSVTEHKTFVPEVQEIIDSVDPKEEAVLKQVREFLYQNMVSKIIVVIIITYLTFKIFYKGFIDCNNATNIF